MRKLTKAFAIFAILSLVFTGMAFAGDGAGQDKDPAGYYQHSVTGQVKYFANGHPTDPSQWTFICSNCSVKTAAAVDVHAGVWSDPYTVTSHNPNGEDYAMTQGFIGFNLEAEAFGNASAFAHVGPKFGDNVGRWNGELAGAFQKEVHGGELSGAGAVSVTTIAAKGYAKGTDIEACENEGLDNAEVDLSVMPGAFQANGAYSDDKDSFIGGGNFSQVDAYGQTDAEDSGFGYYTWRGGWHGHLVYHPDLDAEAYDSITGTALTAGGTLVYAKNTKTSATIAGVTGNFGTAFFCGAEHRNVTVFGEGGVGGYAVLPSVGVAGFNTNFNYSGGNIGGGIAGGYSNVSINQVPGTMTVGASSTAFSKAAVGGGSPNPVD